MSMDPDGASRPGVATRTALIASIAFHIAAIAGARLLSPALFSMSPPARFIDVSVADPLPRGEALTSGVAGAVTPPRPDPKPHRFTTGPSLEPHPDQRRVGRGGTPRATERALRLSDSVEDLTLHTDPALFSDADQLPRIDTSRDRRSREDRRATPEPMELTFLASGTGSRMQRLVPKDTDPATGALGAVPVREGVRPGDPDAPGDGVLPATNGAANVGAEPVAALGVDRGTQREDFRRSAAVALARPPVKKGRASIPTTDHGRPDDTVDSTDEVAARVQSLITASTGGGPLGQGPGGSRGPIDPGRDGDVGPGMRAPAAGDGEFGENAAQLGIENYAAGVTRKVYPYWENAFPVWARIEGRGGVAVIGVTIVADGSVHDIHIVRPSGVPEFDRNVARALEEASPYGPLPERLRDSGLLLHIAFDAMNPAVGRSGPGPGKR